MKINIQFYKIYRTTAPLFILLLCINLKIQGMLTGSKLDPRALQLRRISLQKSQERRQKAQEQNRSSFKIPRMSPTLRSPTINVEEEFLEKEKRVEKKIQEIESKLPENQFFVYEKGTVRGIPILKEIILLSTTFKNMVEDLNVSALENRSIPLDYPYETIESTFSILEKLYNEHQEINKVQKQSGNKEITLDEITYDPLLREPHRSIKELIGITELLDHLACSEKLIGMYFIASKKLINQGKEKLVHALSAMKNYALWKPVLVSSITVSYLQGLMMKSNMQDPRSLLWKKQYAHSTHSIAFSPDNNSCLVTPSQTSHSYSLFDMKKKEELTVTSPGSEPIIFITFHHNGNDIIIVTKHSIIIKNKMLPNAKTIDYKDRDLTKVISNPQNSQQILVAFEFKENYNNLFLCNEDLGNKKFSVEHSFFGHNKSIKDIAFDQSGTKIISVDTGNVNNLKLWDTAKGSLSGEWSLPGINSIAFNSDGKKIIATSSDDKSQGLLYQYQNTNLCLIDLTQSNPLPIKIPLVTNNPGKRALSFILTKDDQIVAWDSLGNIFFITFDENGITNEIQLQEATTWSLASIGLLQTLAISPDSKRIAAGRTANLLAQNFVQLWTTLTDFDSEALKLFKLKNISDSDFYKYLGKYSLIYQFWLNSRKGIKPSQYTMDAAEQSIFNSFPEQIKRLFQ